MGRLKQRGRLYGLVLPNFSDDLLSFTANPFDRIGAILAQINSKK